MNEQYSPQIWQHFRAPHQAGVLNGSGVATGEARTPATKAVLRLQIRTDQGCIREARFQAYGCPSTIAAGDWLCGWLEGRSIAEAMALTSERVAQALALEPQRRHCALLAQDALREALREQNV